MLYLEAGGAHGDAHIRQQGAEVFPFERPGPAFYQDVPPAHGAQHRATHLDGDKGRASLLFGHTHGHIIEPVLLSSPAGSPSWWNINRLISSVLSYLKAHFGCKWVFLCIIQTIIHPQSLQLCHVVN